MSRNPHAPPGIKSHPIIKAEELQQTVKSEPVTDNIPSSHAQNMNQHPHGNNVQPLYHLPAEFATESAVNAAVARTSRWRPINGPTDPPIPRSEAEKRPCVDAVYGYLKKYVDRINSQRYPPLWIAQRSWALVNETVAIYDDGVLLPKCSDPSIRPTYRSTALLDSNNEFLQENASGRLLPFSRRFDAIIQALALPQICDDILNGYKDLQYVVVAAPIASINAKNTYKGQNDRRAATRSAGNASNGRVQRQIQQVQATLGQHDQNLTDLNSQLQTLHSAPTDPSISLAPHGRAPLDSSASSSSSSHRVFVGNSRSAPEITIRQRYAQLGLPVPHFGQAPSAANAKTISAFTSEPSNSQYLHPKPAFTPSQPFDWPTNQSTNPASSARGFGIGGNIIPHNVDGVTPTRPDQTQLSEASVFPHGLPDMKSTWPSSLGLADYADRARSQRQPHNTGAVSGAVEKRRIKPKVEEVDDEEYADEVIRIKQEGDP